MALTTQQKTFISECIDTSQEVLELRSRLSNIISRWNLNEMYTELNSSDIENDPAFTHLTHSEVSNCISAFQTIINSLGDDVNGHATHLIKMKG